MILRPLSGAALSIPGGALAKLWPDDDCDTDVRNRPRRRRFPADKSCHGTGKNGHDRENASILTTAASEPGELRPTGQARPWSHERRNDSFTKTNPFYKSL
jgi:hypothetical protein